MELVFWVRIRLGGREYLGVLDTGATISIVAKKTLPSGSLKNTMTTAAIRLADGHVVDSCGDCEVEVPVASRTIAHRFYVMDTEAFDFVLGTDFFLLHSQIQSLTLQAPYLLYVDHGNGRESVPLEQSEHTSSYLSISKEEPSNMMAAFKTEDYQLLGGVLDQGLKELGYSREDLSVELFASDKQHVLDCYCSKGKNCSYKFYWPSFGMTYGNPRFSELGKVLTKVALERPRMVLCSPDWGAHGGNEYWPTLLNRLTISSVRLPDEAIYVIYIYESRGFSGATYPAFSTSSTHVCTKKASCSVSSSEWIELGSSDSPHSETPSGTGTRHGELGALVLVTTYSSPTGIVSIAF